MNLAPYDRHAVFAAAWSLYENLLDIIELVSMFRGIDLARLGMTIIVKIVS